MSEEKSELKVDPSVPKRPRGRPRKQNPRKQNPLTSEKISEKISPRQSYRWIRPQPSNSKDNGVKRRRKRGRPSKQQEAMLPTTLNSGPGSKSLEAKHNSEGSEELQGIKNNSKGDKWKRKAIEKYITSTEAPQCQEVQTNLDTDTPSEPQGSPHPMKKRRGSSEQQVQAPTSPKPGSVEDKSESSDQSGITESTSRVCHPIYSDYWSGNEAREAYLKILSKVGAKGNIRRLRKD